jgi:hypothetical protein
MSGVNRPPTLEERINGTAQGILNNVNNGHNLDQLMYEGIQNYWNNCFTGEQVPAIPWLGLM